MVYIYIYWRLHMNHAVRDVIYRWAERAGLHPEREKPGLLLPQRPEDTGLGRRRPADVFVPSLAGIPTALDIAVTAPQRSESLREASGKAVAAADAYADVKADHLQTAQVCENQGIRFQPMVVESTGAWSTSASHTLRLLARATAAREGEDAASCYTHLLQELCVTARRFRGRAALRRRAELGSPTEADVTRRDAALLLATAASSSWSCVWSHLLRLHSIAFATITYRPLGSSSACLLSRTPSATCVPALRLLLWPLCLSASRLARLSASDWLHRSSLPTPAMQQSLGRGNVSLGLSVQCPSSIGLLSDGFSGPIKIFLLGQHQKC